MKIERTKNASRNIFFGGLLKIYQILIPFLMRTAMIYFIGVEYLGLSSLFTSILQVLNLAELGVGNAMVYSMYKPIVEDNTKEICALLRLYRTYYRVIGLIIGVLGLLLLPFIPNLIKGDVPENINVYILYLLNLGATVLSYWLFAYKNSLLSAHQRVDITSKVLLITNTLQYILQFMTLCFIKSYYWYLIVALATQVLTNIITAIVVTKYYPLYKPIGKLEKTQVNKINHRIRDLFTSKIGSVIVNSADTIVISAFLGLTMLAIYQNYFYILNSIVGFVTIIFTACTAGIGNSVIVETKEKNYNDLRKFTFIISWIAGFCACCLLCLYQPFMEIWVGEGLMLEFSAIICFCIYYFIFEINQLLNTYKDAAGIWHQDRFRPLITAATNLIMNLIMVQFWGIYGVILSTVLSMLFVGMPWLLHNLFTVLFNKSQLPDYLKRLGLYVVVVIFACTITGFICSFVHLSIWATLVVRAGICCVLPNLIFFIAYYKLPEFEESIQLIDKMTKKKLSLEQRVLHKK
jgi:O-antigen/teichoic acid export membrane protein